MRTTASLTEHNADINPSRSVFGFSIKSVIAVLAIISIVLAAAGYEVYQREIDKHKRLRSRIGELERENQQLKQNAIKSQADQSILLDDWKKIKDSFDQTHASLQGLKEKVSGLDDDYTVWDDVVPEIAASTEDIQKHLGELQARIGAAGVKIGQQAVATNSVAPRQETPRNEPESKPIVEQRTKQESLTVYVTNTGSKYHRAGCQYLRLSSNPISLKEASASGYDPCSRCW